MLSAIQPARRGRTRGVATGLKRKGDTLYVRLHIPVNLRSHFDGKAEIVRSTQTGDPRQAKLRASEIRLDHETKLQRLDDPTFETRRIAVEVAKIAELVEKNPTLTYRDVVALIDPKDAAAVLDAHASGMEIAVANDPILRPGTPGPVWSDVSREKSRRNAEEKIDNGRLDWAFEIWRRSRRRKQTTILAASHKLKDFIEFTGLSHVRDVERKHLTGYRDHIARDGTLSPTTVNDKISTLSAILRSAWIELGLPGFLTERLALPTSGQSTRSKFWSDEDIIHMCAELQKQPSGYGWTFLLALSTGARLGELCHVRTDWLHPDGTIDLPASVTKTEVGRHLPVADFLLEPIRRLAKARGPGAYLLDVSRHGDYRHATESGQIAIMNTLPSAAPVFNSPTDQRVDDRIGREPSKFFVRLRKRLGTKSVMHDLRHHWIGTADGLGVSHRVKMRITGHAAERVGDTYGKTERNVLREVGNQVCTLILNDNVRVSIFSLLEYLEKYPKQRRSYNSNQAKN